MGDDGGIYKKAIAASGSGLVAALATNPLDVVKVSSSRVKVMHESFV